jgi:hypothetical protein
VILSGEHVRALIVEKTRGKWSPSRSKFHDYADARYFLPTREQLEALLRSAAVPASGYVKGSFDCDDFAFYMKGSLADAFTRAPPTGVNGAALCVGVAWGAFETPAGRVEDHALNWALVEEGEASELVFVESQTRKIHPTTHLRSDLWLVLV